MGSISLAVSRLILVLIALAAPAHLMSRTASAELARGSVHIHSRVCDTTATQLYRDCHDNPGPSGAVYTIDNRVPKAINADGNVSFGRATAGDHLVKVVSGVPAGYEGLRAFCSNSTGTRIVEATINFGATPTFWVRVGAGSRLTCDVYFIP
jgi:hypothetical protein